MNTWNLFHAIAMVNMEMVVANAKKHDDDKQINIMHIPWQKIRMVKAELHIFAVMDLFLVDVWFAICEFMFCLFWIYDVPLV